MILSVDIGTSSFKAAVISYDGSPVYYKRILCPSFNKKDFDPEEWKRALAQVGAELADTCIDAISISAHGPSMVAVDANGTPVYPALFWNDGRELRSDNTKSYYLPHANWLRKNEPELFKQVEYFLPPADYLIYLLSGSTLSASPQKSYNDFLWSEDDLSVYGLDSGLFPDICKVSDVQGSVSSVGNSWSSLPEGIPIFSSGSDFIASLIGSASSKSNRICDRAGSSEGLNLISTKNVVVDGIRTLPHAIDGYYNLSVILASTGSIFEWYRRLTGQDKISYQKTLENIDKVVPDSRTPQFYPSFGSDHLWHFEDGAFVGMDPHDGRYEMGYAVLEAILFSLNRGIALLEDNCTEVNEIVVSGGQGRNSIWNRMKADATGKNVIVPEIYDCELSGNAAVAAFAKGVYSSLQEAGESMFKVKDIVVPNKDSYNLFKKRFDNYLINLDNVKTILRKR